MTTFALTVALEDDNGNRYGANDTLRTLRTLANNAEVRIFTEAIGDGIDTDTDQREAVATLQGDGTPDAVRTFGNNVASFARITLNQRAIGWITSDTSTYREV